MINTKKNINCFDCGLCIEDWEDSSIPTTEHMLRAVDDNTPCLFILRLLFQNLVDEMTRLLFYGRYYDIVFQALRWKLRKNRNCCIELNMADIIDWLSVKEDSQSTINAPTCSMETNCCDDDTMCLHCSLSLKNIISLPCCHLVSCERCIEVLEKCPICFEKCKCQIKVKFINMMLK